MQPRKTQDDRLSTWGELALKHAPAVQALIAEADSCLQIQDLGSRLLQVLSDSGLTYSERIAPPNVGVHPSNRAGAMLEPSNVQQLLMLIVQKGFSWLETKLALGCELPPGSKGDEARAANDALAKKSEGILAPCNPERLKILTVVNSHTSAALRCVHYSDQPCVRLIPGCEELSGPDGQHLSQGRVAELCPSLRDPAENGICYTVVRWQIVDLCPGLMEVLAEADNAKHDNVQVETPLQCMLNIHRRIAAVPDGQACA